ncbi:uncharacterized protein LOC119671372 isoform X2 [Teleopsis dalmanni]|nr:uncharacterized protein LOC119671372 isoform X2 [Teleopsis dalmanni]
MKDLRAKASKGKLVAKLTRDLLSTFEGNIQIGQMPAEISYGGMVQLQPYLSPNYGCDIDIQSALSVTVSEEALKFDPSHIDCDVTLAPCFVSNYRNTFRIYPVDKSIKLGQPLRYGQAFRLVSMGFNHSRLVYASPKKLNLESQVPSRYSVFKSGEKNLSVGLSTQETFKTVNGCLLAYSNWICNALTPDEQYSLDGQVVMATSPILIKHFITKKHLASSNILVQTVFGMEYVVSAQNYFDHYKRPLKQNIWRFLNGYNFLIT